MKVEFLEKEIKMKVRDYIKTLKRGEHKFNTVKVHLKGSKCYVEEREFSIERNENGLEQYTLCIKDYIGDVFFPYLCVCDDYVKYYDFGYLKRKIIKDYGELEIKMEND